MPLVDARRLDQTCSLQPRPIESNATEVLFRRAKVLGLEDQLMLELAFKNNLSVRQIARVFRRPAGTISRRMRRVCARLRDPLVIALLEPQCILTSDYRQIAIDYFAKRREIRDLARERNISARQVSAILNFVRGWHRGVRSA